MTFENSFTQLNIENNSCFSNACSFLPTIVPNFWNNLPVFNSYSDFSIPSFSWGDTFNYNNAFNCNDTFNCNNTFNFNNTFNWNNSFSWNNCSGWNNMSTGFACSQTRSDNTIKQNYSTISLEGYNATAGKKLASIAMSRRQTDSWRSIKGTGQCATYTKNAIRAAGLGAYESGHGYQMSSILSRNKNFKQISPCGVDVQKLPAGCVLVYGKGVAGYNPNYGHTEITTGDGRAVSQAITNNVRQNPTAIFIPV